METMQTYFDRYIVAGGILMALLLPLSVVALGYIITGFIYLRRSRVSPRGLVETAKGVSSQAEYLAFRQSLPRFPHPLARLALASMDAAEHGEPWEPDSNPAPLDHIVDKLYHSLSPLATIYTVAPLLGLLGTILGMIQTFVNFVGQRDIDVLSQGISVALVTTMWGLIIAIPAYVFTSVLRAKVFAYEKDILPEDLGEIMRAVHPYAERNRREKQASQSAPAGSGAETGKAPAGAGAAAGAT